MSTIRDITACAMLLLFAQHACAQTVSEYLLLQDIGDYTYKTQGKDYSTSQTRNIPGYATRTAPGFLVGADHFAADHDDKTYETKYVNRTIGFSVEVQVTQHAGVDSDRWLLHEVEGNFRKNLEQPRFKGILREMSGNRIFTYSRGTHYNWISNTVVVDIRYTDLQKTNPEPIEVLQAYLQKHPSTIPARMMDTVHDVLWIKDEMERRLWLCDKWFVQLQMQAAGEKQACQESVTSMKIFLDYREKYYGIAAVNEKNLLAGYLGADNCTGIRAKLMEYKNWWKANKSAAISV